MLATLVEVLHHHTHEHVEDKEADDQEEGDEVEQHPWIVVGQRLEVRKRELEEQSGEGKEKNKGKEIRQGTTGMVDR